MTSNFGTIFPAPSRACAWSISLFAALAFTSLTVVPVGATLTFDVDYSPGVLASPKAAGIVAGVTAATSTWSSIFHDEHDRHVSRWSSTLRR